MATLLVRHTATDYATWRQVYDAFQPTAKEMGVEASAVYQSIENPNEVTVAHDFATVEAAQSFAASSELREAMHAAGVASAPTIWFANRT